MNESRQTHVEWAEYWQGLANGGHDFANCRTCERTLELVGDIDRHKMMIREYDVVLKVLSVLEGTLDG